MCLENPIVPESKAMLTACPKNTKAAWRGSHGQSQDNLSMKINSDSNEFKWTI